MGGVEGEVRGYLGPCAEGLVAGCLRRGFVVAVGDGFCSFVILLVLTGGFSGLPEAAESGDLVWCASFAMACVRKGSGTHRILLEGVGRAYGAYTDVDIIVTRRSGPAACDSHFYRLKPGSDPEEVAREAARGSPDQVARYVMEEAEDMRMEGGCAGAGGTVPGWRWSSEAANASRPPQGRRCNHHGVPPLAELQVFTCTIKRVGGGTLGPCRPHGGL